MYSNVVNSRFKAVLKRLFSLLLMFSLYFNAFSSAHASTLSGSSWSLSNPISNGASVVYQGTRNAVINGANKVITGAATIAPVAADVAKFIGRVGAAAVVTTVLDGLLNGADYVLDPANNTIRYKDKDASIQSNILTNTQNYSWTSKADGKFNSAVSACTAWSFIIGKYYNNVTASFKSVSNQSGSNKSGMASCTVFVPGFGDHTSNLFYTLVTPIDTSQDEQKSISIPQLTQQIQDKAKAGDVNAQALMRAVAADIVQDAETDDTKAKTIVNQLDSTSAYPSDTTADTKSDTKTNADGSTSTTATTDIPAACSWMPSVCEAMQVIIQKPVVWAENIKAAYNDAVDYFKNDDKPEQDNDTPEIKDLELPTLNTNTFKATAGCPAPIPVNITIGTKSTTEISYEPICQFAEKWSFVSPLIGFISGAMILIGVGRKGEDSEL